MPNSDVASLEDFKRSIDLAAKHGNLFDILDKKLKDVPEDKRVILSSLFDYIKNTILIYVYNKSASPVEKSRNEKINIMTAHPIGNLPVDVNIYTDILVRAIKGAIRTEYYKGQDAEAREYKKDISSYLEKLLVEIKNLQSLKAKENFKSIENYDLEKFIDLFINTIASFEVTKEVINEEEQIRAMGLKKQYLASRFSRVENDQGEVTFEQTAHHQTKSWASSDQDGNPLATIVDRSKFGPNLNKQNFAALYAQLAGTNQDYHQYRRSAQDGKKGVLSWRQIFEKIKLPEINAFGDLFDEDKIVALEKIIASLRYPENDDELPPANITIDILLNCFAPNALGSVISDFPEDKEEGKKLLLQLMFLSKVVGKYLTDEKALDAEHGNKKGQIFMPLCESRQSMQNFCEILEGLKYDILEQVALCKDEEELRSLLKTVTYFEGDGKFLAFGLFSGPSDAIKDGGRTAEFMIVANILKSLTAHDEFKSKLLEQVSLKYPQLAKEFGLENLEFNLEFGKGTAHRRSNVTALFQNMPITYQGFGTAFSLSTTIRNLFDVISADYSQEDIKSLIDYIEEYENYVEQAALAHAKFHAEEAASVGRITEHFNGSKEEERFRRIFSKPVSNPEGQRGFDREGKYALKDRKDTRAIEDNFFVTCIGLVAAPNFPEKNIKNYIEDFGHFISTSLGLSQVFHALSETIITDKERAKFFRFDDSIIKDSFEYQFNIIKYLAGELEVDISHIKFEEYRDDKNLRLDIVKNITSALFTKAHERLRPDIALFNEMVQITKKLSDDLTEACDCDNPNSEAISVIGNILANTAHEPPACKVTLLPKERVRHFLQEVDCSKQGSKCLVL